MMSGKKLIQDQTKQIIQIPIKTLYGSKYLLFVINIILLCIVIILFIVCASLYFLAPVKNVLATFKVNDSKEAFDTFTDSNSIVEMYTKREKQGNGDYGIITSENIFSPERKEWFAKVSIQKTVKVKKKKVASKRALPRKTRKFILYGIIIAGDVKKALINSTLRGGSKKRTMYVKEGEEIEGYIVTSIESNHIKLHWQGEEIIVELYSGVDGVRQPGVNEMVNINQEKEVFKNPFVKKESGEKHRENINPFKKVLDKRSPEQLSKDQEK